MYACNVIVDSFVDKNKCNATKEMLAKHYSKTLEVACISFKWEYKHQINQIHTYHRFIKLLFYLLGV